jgi:hypothetical protein
MEAQRVEVADELLLKECPICGYSLEGLPVQHVCPECGREFDRRWRVFGAMLGWRHQSPTQHAVSLIGLGGVLFFALLSLIREAWDWNSWMCWLNLMIVVLGPAVILRLRQLQTRSSRFVVVDANSMAIVESRRPKKQSYALSEIEQAMTGSNEWLILRSGGRERKVCRFPNGRHEAQACADYINDQLAQRKAAAIV